MGYQNDLGTSEVESIDILTGYPKDKWGHLLNSISHRDGSVIEDWDKKGTRLPNFTNPYGHLEFACGSGDDFHCFDYEHIDAGPRGSFIILHSTINSETGCFIEDGRYVVLPVNTMDEERKAIVEARVMVSDALDCCDHNFIKHTKKGWNQSPEYFVNAVSRNLFKYKFEDISERQIRFGSKTVEKIIKEILTDKK